MSSSLKNELLLKIKNSPSFFLRTADLEMKNKNYTNAVEILNEGLKIYPDHPVAYILLGKAFTLQHNYDLAEKSFKKGSELIRSEKTYNFYMNELNFVKSKMQQPDQLKDEVSLESKNQETITTEITAIEDRLDQLAKMISEAKIPRPTGKSRGYEPFFGLPEKGRIVSETLAKIYLAQGELDEAVKVYERLIKKNPENTDYYSRRINEIRALVST